MPSSNSESYNLHYEPHLIDKKWQTKWEKDNLYVAKDDDPREKHYALTMFPYTSGDLHVGHWYAEAPADAHSRYKRMQGYNVLHPMGFDSFGLPAENAAIQRNIHPRDWTLGNVDKMRDQLKSLGATYDWSREIITCLPDYYMWNQWFFLKFFKEGLAYKGMAPVNWCEKDQTTLAREQVDDEGNCERCGTPVYQRDLEQWFFKITDYAEELLNHSGTEWPAKINLMQDNWIGKSEGTEIDFPIEDSPESIKVFTTRPDTIYGVTFMVLAPEHPLVSKLTTGKQQSIVKKYIADAQKQTEIERLSTDNNKTGVPLGSYCINPLNGERVALFIADYVLGSYGTGAVMGVPAHDQRDFDFAKKQRLPIKVVVSPPSWDNSPLEEAWTAGGTLVNSEQFNQLDNDQAKHAITDFLNEHGIGKKTVTYRIRDWLISRQRYWGTPIPIIYCKDCGVVPVPEQDLPVLLPEHANFKPTGESPLKDNPDFLNTPCPKCNKPSVRETDTMDTFVDSSWYQFRYTSPDSKQSQPFDPALVKKWAPVDLYTGGAEHAVMHLLYARFFTKALRDLNIIDFGEPFKRLFNQGIILGEDHEKMSKSRGNVVNPDQQITLLGADAIRAYLMFVGPWEQGGNWDTKGIRGISRWFNKLWDLKDFRNRKDNLVPESSYSDELTLELNKTIKKVTTDIENFHFNTAIASLMTLTNLLWKIGSDGDSLKDSHWDEAYDSITLLLAPIAPHITEEIWELTGHGYSIHNQEWPTWNENLAVAKTFTLVIQINGKIRDKIDLPENTGEAESIEKALESSKIQELLQGAIPKNTIYVKNRLINFVID